MSLSVCFLISRLDYVESNTMTIAHSNTEAQCISGYEIANIAVTFLPLSNPIWVG